MESKCVPISKLIHMWSHCMGGRGTEKDMESEKNWFQVSFKLGNFGLVTSDSQFPHVNNRKIRLAFQDLGEDEKGDNKKWKLTCPSIGKYLNKLWSPTQWTPSQHWKGTDHCYIPHRWGSKPCRASEAWDKIEQPAWFQSHEHLGKIRLQWPKAGLGLPGLGWEASSAKGQEGTFWLMETFCILKAW